MELFSDCSSGVRAAEHVYLQDGLFHVKQVCMFTWWTAHFCHRQMKNTLGKEPIPSICVPVPILIKLLR